MADDPTNPQNAGDAVSTPPANDQNDSRGSNPAPAVGTAPSKQTDPFKNTIKAPSKPKDTSNFRTDPATGMLMHRHSGYADKEGKPIWHPISQKHGRNEEATQKMHEENGMGKDGYGAFGSPERAKNQSSGLIPMNPKTDMGDVKNKGLLAIKGTAAMANMVGNAATGIVGIGRKLLNATTSSNPLSGAGQVIGGALADSVQISQGVLDDVDKAFGISDGTGQQAMDTLKGKMWDKDKKEAQAASSEVMDNIDNALEGRDISELDENDLDKLMDDIGTWKKEIDDKQINGEPLTLGDRTKLKMYEGLYRGIGERAKTLSGQYREEATQERTAAAHQKRVEREQARQALMNEYNNLDRKSQIAWESLGSTGEKKIELDKNGLPSPRFLSRSIENAQEKLNSLKDSDDFDPNEVKTLEEYINAAKAKRTATKERVSTYKNEDLSMADRLRAINGSDHLDDPVNANRDSLRRNDQRATEIQNRLTERLAPAYYDALKQGLTDQDIDADPGKYADAIASRNKLRTSPQYLSGVNLLYNNRMLENYLRVRHNINTWAGADPARQEEARKVIGAMQAALKSNYLPTTLQGSADRGYVESNLDNPFYEISKKFRDKYDTGMAGAGGRTGGAGGTGRGSSPAPALSPIVTPVQTEEERPEEEVKEEPTLEEQSGSETQPKPTRKWTGNGKGVSKPIASDELAAAKEDYDQKYRGQDSNKGIVMFKKDAFIKDHALAVVNFNDTLNYVKSKVEESPDVSNWRDKDIKEYYKNSIYLENIAKFHRNKAWGATKEDVNDATNLVKEINDQLNKQLGSDRFNKIKREVEQKQKQREAKSENKKNPKVRPVNEEPEKKTISNTKYEPSQEEIGKINDMFKEKGVKDILLDMKYRSDSGKKDLISKIPYLKDGIISEKEKSMLNELISNTYRWDVNIRDKYLEKLNEIKPMTKSLKIPSFLSILKARLSKKY